MSLSILRAAMRIAVVLVVSIFAVTSVQAKEDERISARERSKVIEATAKLVEDKYFDVEKAVTIAKDLMAQERQGTFETVETKVQLASALSQFLHPYDGHFVVMWTNGEDTPDHHDANWDKIARRTNFGFETVKVMPGNVGYISLTSFEAPAIAAKTAVAAMALVGNADALILDLTANGGGEPEMVQLMLSYFLGPEPKQVGELYWRDKDLLQQYWTQPHVPGQRFLDKPLYVLGGAGTASASEMFMMQVKRHGRGLTVGQRTYGAGNAGQVFHPSDEFDVFIAIAGPLDPELVYDGVGIAADVETKAGEELSRALLLAWDEILKTATDPGQIAVITRARVRKKAELDPLILTEEQMRASTGDFGDRQIVYRDGQLIYERGRRAPEILIPAPGDVFFPTGLPGIQVQLIRNRQGQVIQMVMSWENGHVEKFARREGS